jgi:hypothetical protein
MKVRVYDTDEIGNETLRCECELRDCFPDEIEEFYRVEDEIKRAGRCWVGGGGAPMIIIMGAE